MTGLTPALTWVLGYLESDSSIVVILWHFDIQKDEYWSETAPTKWAYESGYFDGAKHAKERILAHINGSWEDWPEELFKDSIGGEEAEKEAAAVSERLRTKGYEVDEFSEGLAAVKLDGKWGFIDPAGQVVVPLRYDYAWPFHKGRARVVRGRKYGFVDKGGTEVVLCKYDYARPFREGFARVKLAGKYGFVNLEGTQVIPLRYDFCVDFRGGWALVKLDGEQFWIDKEGNRVDNKGVLEIPRSTFDSWTDKLDDILPEFECGEHTNELTKIIEEMIFLLNKK